MLRPHTYRHIAAMAEYLASVASGEGDFALADQLWAFEAKHEQLAEKAWVVLGDQLRAGTVDPDMPMLHALRKRHLISREEFVEHRATLDQTTSPR